MSGDFGGYFKGGVVGAKLSFTKLDI